MKKIQHNLITLKEYQDYLLQISKDEDVREVATQALVLIEGILTSLKKKKRDVK